MAQFKELKREISTPTTELKSDVRRQNLTWATLRLNCYNTYIHTYIIHAYIHTYIIHAYKHTCMNACIHTCTHTYLHTYTHTHTHINTHLSAAHVTTSTSGLNTDFHFPCQLYISPDHLLYGASNFGKKLISMQEIWNSIHRIKNEEEWLYLYVTFYLCISRYTMCDKI